MKDDSEDIPFQSFLQEALVSSSGLGRDVHPVFSLPTTASPTLQGALKNGFGEVVVAFDTPEPCKFPSLDSCQKRFLWTHKEVDFAPHLVVGLVLQVGVAGKFPHALGFESLDPLFRVSKHGPCFTTIGENGGDKTLAEFELAYEADGVALGL